MEAQVSLTVAFCSSAFFGLLFLIFLLLTCVVCYIEHGEKKCKDLSVDLREKTVEKHGQSQG